MYFVLVNCSWVQGPTLEYIWYTQWQATFVIQVSVANNFLLGIGFVYTSTFCARVCLTWTCADLVCAATVSLCIYISALLCLATLIPWYHPPPLAVTVFLLPLPHTFLTFEGRDLIKTSHLRPSASKIPVLCTMSSCGSPYGFSKGLHLLVVPPHIPSFTLSSPPTPHLILLF